MTGITLSGIAVCAMPRVVSRVVHMLHGWCCQDRSLRVSNLRKIGGSGPGIAFSVAGVRTQTVARPNCATVSLTCETTMPWYKRRGFTLIELLIVVVIIGVLAAIAVPKFQNTKGKANAASLRADLRNLVTAEEAYFYDNSVYTTSINALNMRMTSGVTITFGSATAAGWSAKVTHPLAWPIECAVFIGTVPALAPAKSEGLIACQ